MNCPKCNRGWSEPAPEKCPRCGARLPVAKQVKQPVRDKLFKSAKNK